MLSLQATISDGAEDDPDLALALRLSLAEAESLAAESTAFAESNAVAESSASAAATEEDADLELARRLQAEWNSEDQGALDGGAVVIPPEEDTTNDDFVAALKLQAEFDEELRRYEARIHGNQRGARWPKRKNAMKKPTLCSSFAFSQFDFSAASRVA